MNTTITLPLADPAIGCHQPKEFAVRLDRTECDALYAIRAGLIETDSPIMGRPANTATGRTWSAGYFDAWPAWTKSRSLCRRRSR